MIKKNTIIVIITLILYSYVSMKLTEFIMKTITTFIKYINIYYMKKIDIFS